jgi:hypothetical protein
MCEESREILSQIQIGVYIWGSKQIWWCDDLGQRAKKDTYHLGCTLLSRDR